MRAPFDPPTGAFNARYTTTPPPDSVMQDHLRIGYLLQADVPEMAELSGPQLHVQATIEGLTRRGHHVRLVAAQNRGLVWTDDREAWQVGQLSLSATRSFRLVERAVRGMQSRLHFPFLRLFGSYRFAEVCATALSGYDLMYERHGFLGYGGLIAARRLNVPLILEVNGDFVEEYRKLGIELSGAQWAAIHLITRLTLEHADRIIAVGETIKQRIARRWRIPAAKISVVTNGADIRLFTATTALQVESVRTRYGLESQPTIIFVGSFQPWHGVDLLVEALREVVARRSGVRLILVGDGPRRVEIERRAGSLGLGERVIFTGSVPHQEVAALLQVADVAVIYHSGAAAEIVETPLKLFEYMAAGKALVAPAVPNMQRLLAHRVNALLVPPDSPPALAEALLELLDDSDLRAALGAAARTEAQARHSWDRVVTDIEAIFRDVLAHSKTLDAQLRGADDAAPAGV
jgi:glycosyltransferase involved in cell wall biosynthesis